VVQEELLYLAGLLIGMDTGTGSVILPGAMHNAHWKSKAIIHGRLSCFINEAVIHLRAPELQALQRLNRSVVLVYIQSWFTSRSAADAAINDIHLTGRLTAFDDKALKYVGLNARRDIRGISALSLQH